MAGNYPIHLFSTGRRQILDPVSVELTYGLERIAIALQRVNTFRQIQWNPTYGDVNLQAEQEHSRYYFEVAEVDRLRQMYDLFEAEAKPAWSMTWFCPPTIMC